MTVVSMTANSNKIKNWSGCPLLQRVDKIRNCSAAVTRTALDVHNSTKSIRYVFHMSSISFCQIRSSRAFWFKTRVKVSTSRASLQTLNTRFQSLIWWKTTFLFYLNLFYMMNSKKTFAQSKQKFFKKSSVFQIFKLLRILGKFS